jgi:hypothetical protein
MLLLLFQVLRAAELPDCAYTYVQACQEAGLLIPQQQPQHHQQQGGLAGRQSSSWQGDEDCFDQQQRQPPALGLFDILGLRTRMLLQNSSRAGHAGGTTASGEASGPELVQMITLEYQQYLCALVNSL